MKIALAQLNYTVGNVADNTDKIVAAIQRAQQEKADLVLFAEQAVSGIPCLDFLRKPNFLELCEEALERIAAAAQNISVIVGTPVLTHEGTVGAAAVIQNGQVTRLVGKNTVRVRREVGFLVSGHGPEHITVDGRRIVLTVGDDLYQTTEFDKQADLIVNIAARRYCKGNLTLRGARVRDIAFLQQKTVITLNQVGANTEMVYDGLSGVVAPTGEVLILLKSFEEDFQIYDTEKQYTPIPLPVTATDRSRILFEATVCGLRDYFRKNGYTKASIGLSGGLDSAVLAVLAVEALGAENVRAVMLPSEFTSKESLDDAAELARNLHLELDVIPINSSYEAVVNALRPLFGDQTFDATEENIQARLRTVLLMALQNKEGYVLLNSSNKSENALGICTLYGDTAGAISITGDLYKTEMYDLARYINRRGGAKIPENILTKEPSSELAPDQKDSDTLPSYEVVDAILYRMIEEGQSREQIIDAGFDSAEVQGIYEMLIGSEKKRFQYPPVLRLSAVTLGNEYRIPLTHKYGN